MSKKKHTETNNKIKKKELSQDTKINLIITIGVILFILFIFFLVYLVIIDSNPNAFKNEIKNELVTNTSENDIKKEQLATTPTFNLVAEDISISGKLPKLMESKFYLECFNDGSINIYSKYTYALSKSRNYEKEKGIILTIRIVKEEDLPRVEKLEGKYTIIGEMNDYIIIAVEPKSIQYIRDDDISKSNYERLSAYRQEIIDSITITEAEEGIENTIEK